MIGLLSIINKVKISFLLQSIKQSKTYLILIFGFSLFTPLIYTVSYASSYTSSPHPIWLQEMLKQSDKLSDKSPVLALNYTKKILLEHDTKLSNIGRAALLSRVAENLNYMGQFTESLKYVKLSYALKPDLTDNDGISLLIIHGNSIDRLGEPEEAMAIYLQAEKTAKDTENKKLLAETYSSMGGTLSRGINYSEALKYFHQAYVIFKTLDEELEIAYLNVQMAYAYSRIYDNEKSMVLSKEAIKYFSLNEYHFDELFAQTSLAETYMVMEQYKDAINVYHRIIELSKKVQNKNIIEVAYLGLAKAYFRTEQLAKARLHFRLYKKVHIDRNDPYQKLDTLHFNALLDFSDKKIALAQEHIKQAEEIFPSLNKTRLLFWRINLLDLKADIAVFNKDFQSAYQFQKEARSLYKNYQSKEREKIRSKYKVMFDTDQALLQNQILERDKKLDKVALESSAEQNKLQVLLTVTISFLALGLLFFVYRQRINSERLNKLANTDMLTKLANRRYTFAFAEEMLKKGKKNKEIFSIIVFDIDHFKRINDTYGHSSGDVALKDIAHIANKYVRDNDVLGRIGGEEFLVVLPTASAKQAYEVAERIRQAIVVKDMTLGSEIINISASFGIAEFNQSQSNFNQLFNEADLALYQAKNSGRNCTSIAD